MAKKKQQGPDKAELSALRAQGLSDLSAQDKSKLRADSKSYVDGQDEAKVATAVEKGINAIIANGGAICTGKQLATIGKPFGKDAKFYGRKVMRGVGLHPQAKAGAGHKITVAAIKSAAKKHNISVPADLKLGE